ncbi:polyribonucleotide 5'-hydroxyl-kinase Clp1-like protein [Euroglyphus maynei]|uniref:Protein CLP1 homolog n=1 Tax=Euroglyphus maynei TaxID=6958 RepID=A0A1Y3ARI8_EURMA|nr:polyribonucleotide 5'-hydroxyl-kinase Clp1-like protein [Euroglyphus maynei]
MSTGESAEIAEPRTYSLEKGEELRFEVENESVQCQLIEGKAELFGTELRLEQKYTFQKGAKVAVFTFHGCKLKLYGTPEVEYVASETPMTIYLNLGNSLEGLREAACKEDKHGPNVLVAGPTDVGKTTFCRILLNYAVRNDRIPIYVDLDLGQGSLTIPGNIGAVVIEKPADVEDSFQITAPVVFHYGHLTQSKNTSLYNIIMKSLAEVVDRKKHNEPSIKYSGTIVNTSGWVQAYGYQSILQAIEHFAINVVLVLDQERLYSELVRDLKSKPAIKVLLVPKSGGVVSRSREFRSEMRDQKIRSYFYGTTAKPLYPYSFDIPFAQFTAYKIGSPNLPDSCLPIGMKSTDNSTKLMPIQPSSSILNHIFSISCSSSEQDLDKVITTNIYGFIAVTQVNVDRQVATYKCYSVSMLPDERQNLEKGGKIIMPPSALHTLTRLNTVYPMLFKLSNKDKNRHTHSGVLEFIAEEGKVYLPYWMMRNLLLDEGSMLHVQSVSLPVATFSKFQPQNVDFLDIHNPKAVLENALRNFACLTTGDVIAINYNNKVYELSVLETRPGPAVRTDRTESKKSLESRQSIG